MRHVSKISRRLFLGGLAAPALTTLTGCADLVGSAVNSCPSDAASNEINWIPDVAHPVYWGVQDLTRSRKPRNPSPPRNMLIYYPAGRGEQHPSLLRLCIARWPVVLFLHGDPPSGVPINNWYRSWWELGSTLARCGYVVVVPQLSNGDTNAPISNDAATIAAAVADTMSDINWVRTQWRGAPWVDQRPTSTAVVGHSRGGVLAAEVAAAHPEMGAFVSLSGAFFDTTDPPAILQAVTVPSFYQWGTGALFDDPGQWDQLGKPKSKYAAIYQRGEHFDYVEAIDAGGARRGPCAFTGRVANALAALFISSNVASLTQIPINLSKPSASLTPLQAIFAADHLRALDLINNERGCRVDLKWNVDGTIGAREIGPG